MKTQFTRIITTLWLLAVLTGEGRAQSSLLQINPLGQDHNGWRLYNATASFGYSSLALPANSSALGFSLDRLEGDYDGTASALFGYNYTSPKSSVSLRYSPSFVGRVRYSQLSAFNQSMNFSASTKIAARWDLSVAVTGSDTTLDQLLSTPAILSVATNPQATLDNLVQGAHSGQYTSDQLASILTGTPYVITPSQSIIYGTKYLSASLISSASYRHSPRLSFNFTAGAMHSQTRNDEQKNLQGQTNFLIPQTTSEQAGVSVNYSLSPRTDIGAQANSSQIDSTLGRYIVTNTMMSLNRRLSPQWFVGVSGGAGFANVLRTDSQYPAQIPGTGYTAQGNMGYTAGDYSLTGSYSRMVADTYGFQSQSSNTLTGSWQWSRPGRSWSLNASGGLQRMVGGVLGDIQYWHINGGFARSLSQQLSANFTYGYVDRRTGTSNLVGVGQQNLNGSSVRVTLVWNPQGRGEANVGGTGANGSPGGAGVTR